MKLIKFRVFNYKSIKDSDFCWLASDVTTLAGKNESGKSGILQALRDFDVDIEKIPDEALPLDGEGEPRIELYFQVEKGALDAIATDRKIAINKEVREYITKHGVGICKSFNGHYALVEKELTDLLNKEVYEKNEQLKKRIEGTITKISKLEGLNDLEVPNLLLTIDEVKTGLGEFINKVKEKTASFSEDAQIAQVKLFMDLIRADMDGLSSVKPSEVFIEELNAYTPNFIFFSDFDDILPFELPLTEAKENHVIQDFAKVAKLDLKKVLETQDTQQRRNILSKHSASITGDFMEYWGQNQLNIKAEADGERLRIGVEESGKTILFQPGQRSKGFQWFLSFYLRLNSQKDKVNIILIDEPGLYLHAKAQGDVLKVFEEIAKESQVIFSTHSPYLIDAQRLDRIRLVIKDDIDGSRVENKIHKNADHETLTPIITAIGLDVSNAFSIAGKQNVLLEGISDYYFLQALKELIPKQKFHNLNLIPCVGAPKIPYLASLLLGWDLEFITILDFDPEGKRNAKDLIERLSVPEERIVYVSAQDGYAIEDLFTNEDFSTLILEEGTSVGSEVLNSKFLKEQEIDKVLLSKKFFDKVKANKESINLSRETIDNFKAVFSKASSLF